MHKNPQVSPTPPGPEAHLQEEEACGPGVTLHRNPLQLEDGPVLDLDKSLDLEDGPVLDLDKSLDLEDGLVLQLDLDLHLEDGPVLHLDQSLDLEDGLVLQLDLDLYLEDGLVLQLDLDLYLEDGPVLHRDLDLYLEDGPVLHRDLDLDLEDGPVLHRDLDLDLDLDPPSHLLLSRIWFTVDLLASKDLAFHFNPRFNDYGKKVLVRNSFIGGSWGKEEREVKHFPFVPGQAFEIKIMCTNTEFKVAVNNSHLLEYKHRVRDLRSINSIGINYDLTLSKFHMETVS
ncbi:unnamed protein product [Pleuronectes platessa]|uniref:Galectin n=1 Tax=Pleuronectes platessa TaxID=8262 RepID=A0A9N7TQA6_PLEPL|nr:unnamed protein product [Pleuronectes platessa]